MKWFQQVIQTLDQIWLIYQVVINANLRLSIAFNMKNNLYLCPNHISTNRLLRFVSIHFNKIIRAKRTVILKITAYDSCLSPIDLFH